jgi:putative inorganic carbon (HCO3(-)) transporter
MASKSKFLDYEPISKPRHSNKPQGYGFEPDATGASASDFESKFNSDSRERVVGRERASNAHAPQLLKRGHAFTFAGLFLFTFLLFFRPYELSPSLGWLTKGALVTAIATLVFFIPTQLGLENRITVRIREINLILLLLLLCLISVPLALDKALAFNSFIEYLKIVIMFVVAVNVLRTEKQLKALLLLVLVATSILSFSAINDYRSGNLTLRGVRIEGVIGGLFENPNDLALHFVTFFPIIVVLALASRSLFGKLIYFTAAVSALGGTIVTFSRGGFLGLIFVIAVLVWRLGKRNILLVGVISASLIFFLLIMAPVTYRNRMSTSGDASSEARLGELKRSVFLTIRHPVFGVGMGNYILFSDREQATHNAYTQVAAEIGLAGALVYILFLITTIRRVAKIPNPKDVDKKKRLLPYLAIGVQASLIGYMVSSFFASVAFVWYVYYLAAYGICISRLYQSSVATESAPSLQRINRYSA